MGGTVFVYSLCEPDTGEIRYVGSTVDVAGRFQQHLAAQDGPKAEWIASLALSGKCPRVELLASSDDREFALAHEGYLIASLRDRGANLLNERSVARHARVPASWRTGGAVSVGRDLFVAYLASSGMSQCSMADLLGVNQSSISIWVQGRSRPEPHHRLLLEELAGIAVDSWMTTDEREALFAARERIRLAAKGAA